MARVSVFALMERSIKNMGAVNSRVKDYALELIKRSYHEGINIQITSGFRSYAEQTALYNQGRTTAGKVVTNARAGQSIHNFGYAVDYVVISLDGNTANWVVDNQWRRVATIGKELGFQWGGDWAKFRDYPHLDFQGDYKLDDFRNGKRPTLPPVPKRGYVGVGDSGTEVIQYQKDMNKLGYKLAVDGVFGDGSEDALIDFQKKKKLTPDGFYGKMSKVAVQKALVEKEGYKEEVPKIDADLKKAIELDFIDAGDLDKSVTFRDLGIVAAKIYDSKK